MGSFGRTSHGLQCDFIERGAGTLSIALGPTVPSHSEANPPRLQGAETCHCSTSSLQYSSAGGGAETAPVSPQQQQSKMCQRGERRALSVSSAGMRDQLIANMKARVAQCRRLATLIHNPEAVRSLLQMAEQAEADMRALEAEKAADTSPPTPAS